MKKKNNLKSLDQFVEEQYGKKGTAKRDKFEKLSLIHISEPTRPY